MSVSRFTSYSQAEESRYWEAMGMAMVGDIELTPAEVAAIEPCKLHLALAGQIALVDRKIAPRDVSRVLCGDGGGDV